MFFLQFVPGIGVVFIIVSSNSLGKSILDNIVKAFEGVHLVGVLVETGWLHPFLHLPPSAQITALETFWSFP